MLDEAILVGSILCQGKSDIKNGFIFDGLFLAPKKENCLTNDEFGSLEEHKMS